MRRRRNTRGSFRRTRVSRRGSAGRRGRGYGRSRVSSRGRRRGRTGINVRSAGKVGYRL